MKIYIGSDWHFSRYKKSTGKIIADKNTINEILKKYKNTVKKDDIFIFLGDLTAVRDNNPDFVKKAINEIKKLPGTKILIRGNNDIEPDDYYKNIGFVLVEHRLEIGDFIFTHEPCELTKNQINIHGHIHGADDYWDVDGKNHVDGFTGLFDMYPIELSTLLKQGHRIDKKLLNSFKIKRLYADINTHIYCETNIKLGFFKNTSEIEIGYNK